MTEPDGSSRASSAELENSYSKLRKPILVDAVVIVALAVATYFVSGYFHAFENVVVYVEQHDSWELDEFLIVGNVLLVAGVVFFVRRFREMRSLVRELDHALNAIHESQQVIESKQRELHAAAMTDPLTGLPNRGCLMNHIEHVVADGAVGDGLLTALIFFDLDRFKQINDLHGHKVGDELLREIARRIQQTLSVGGGVPSRKAPRMAARLGGDEFVAVVRDVADLDEVRSLADALLRSLSEPYSLIGVSVMTTASLGVVVKSEAHTNATLLLSDADAAMYEAKKKGRGTVVLFERSMRDHLMRRVRLGAELRGAIERNELYLVYHPIVSLVSGRTEGAEALVRWTHPELGGISPAEFVPIAEDSEVIFELGAWVLEESLRQMADWMERCPDAAPEVISVNLSRKQFADPNLLMNFREIIRRSGVPSDRIQLEITEDLHAGEMDSVLKAMHELKGLGVRLAVDDFGTGTSTFSAIEQFPIDTVKIDMSLVSQIVSSKDEAAIIHSLAMLVRNLDVKLVAEGVENPQQVTVLQDLGCPFAQGYLFSKPLSAHDFEERFVASPLDSMTVTGFSNFPELWSGKLRSFQQMSLD